MSVGLDGTWTLKCGTKEPVSNGHRIRAASEAVGRPKRYEPIAARVAKV